MTNCVECGQPTNNPKFCSRSCSATGTNRIKSRKHPIKYCKCGKTIWHDKTNCKDCWNDIVANRKSKPRNPNPKKQNIRKDKTRCGICDCLLSDNNSYRHSNGTFHPHCKPCHNEYTKNIQREFKAKCIQYKGGKCVRCGFNLNQAALQFHHLDPTKKEITLSTYRSQKFDDRITPELDKCILLCSNCHKSFHSPTCRNLAIDSITSLADLIEFNSYEENSRSHSRKKRKFIKLLGGRCSICGFNKNYGALHFHHINPEEKEFCIGNKGYSEERLLLEVKKCVLLCSNCHEIHHSSVKNNNNSLSHINSLANLIPG